MTAPDVRTAAQAEADKRFPETPFAPENESLAEAFVDGAVWGAAYVTPTREQVARKLALTDDYDGCFERIDAWEALEQWERDARPQEEPTTDREDVEFWMRRADAVLELMNGLSDGKVNRSAR